MGSRFGALAEEEYDKIAPDCLHAARTDRLQNKYPKEERGTLAGEVTSEMQVVGKAASIAIQTQLLGAILARASHAECVSLACLYV